MDIKLKYRNVFYSLYQSSKGLLAYTLYSRYNIQPTEAVEFINQYEKEGIITIDNEQRICLTPKGRNEISTILNGLKIKFEQKSHYYESIKSNDTIVIFEPYLPDINFYNRYEGEKQKETSK